MDGRLARLRQEIGATALDFVEGFTPPPLGDLELEEARAAWPMFMGSFMPFAPRTETPFRA